MTRKFATSFPPEENLYNVSFDGSAKFESG